MARKPTLKQRKAVSNAVENGGSISQAMRDAGYSHATAKNPSKLTETEGWSLLMAEYFPDDLINKKLKEGLDAFKTITSPTEADKIDPDFSVRHKYIDTILKLKNKYPATKTELSGPNGTPLQINVIDHEINIPKLRQATTTPDTSNPE